MELVFYSWKTPSKVAFRGLAAAPLHPPLPSFCSSARELICSSQSLQCFLSSPRQPQNSSEVAGPVNAFPTSSRTELITSSLCPHWSLTLLDSSSVPSRNYAWLYPPTPSHTYTPSRGKARFYFSEHSAHEENLLFPFLPNLQVKSRRKDRVS